MCVEPFYRQRCYPARLHESAPGDWRHIAYNSLAWQCSQTCTSLVHAAHLHLGPTLPAAHHKAPLHKAAHVGSGRLRTMYRACPCTCGCLVLGAAADIRWARAVDQHLLATAFDGQATKSRHLSPLPSSAAAAVLYSRLLPQTCTSSHCPETALLDCDLRRCDNAQPQPFCWLRSLQTLPP